MYCSTCGAGMDPAAPRCERCGAATSSSSPIRAPQNLAVASYKNWNSGGWITALSAAVAVLSLFLPWVNMVLVSSNGLASGGIFALVLYAYPVWIVITNRDLNKAAGVICGIAAALYAVLFIQHQMIDVFGYGANFSAIGVYVFLVASLGLAAGAAMYRPSGMEARTGQRML